MKKHTLTVVLLFAVYIFSGCSHVDVRAQIEEIKNVEERLAAVDEILQSNASADDKFAVLDALPNRHPDDDPNVIAKYLESVGGNDSYDDAIRARAYKSAFKVMKSAHQFGEARRLVELAYKTQPERTDDEQDQKADLYYQIAEDERSRGNDFEALQMFLNFGELYPHHSRQQLQLFAYFEVIPNLVMKIEKNSPGSGELNNMLIKCQESNQPGLMMGAAMMHFGRGDYLFAVEAANRAAEMNDEPRWALYRDMLYASIALIFNNYDQLNEQLDLIAQNPKHDNWMTYYTRIMGMTISDVYPGKYDLSYPLYHWFITSSIFQNEDRRGSVSGGSISHILAGYAIDLMYLDRSDDARHQLEQVYQWYGSQVSGKDAGLILAEQSIKDENFDRAEEILNSMTNEDRLDSYLGGRIKLVEAQLLQAKGMKEKSDALFDDVAAIPNRPGDEDNQRLKNDAKTLKHSNIGRSKSLLEQFWDKFTSVFE